MTIGGGIQNNAFEEIVPFDSAANIFNGIFNDPANGLRLFKREIGIDSRLSDNISGSVKMNDVRATCRRGKGTSAGISEKIHDIYRASVSDLKIMAESKDKIPIG